jgi:hypothetical protein
MIPRLPIGLLLLLALGSGCASDPVRLQLGEPSTKAPWRLAILPTAQTVNEGEDPAPVVSDDVLREARACIALQIPNGSFEVVPLPIVDRDYPPEYGPPVGPATLIEIGKSVKADLILVPEIFSWDRGYYLLHAVSRVGLRAKLYDGWTGEALYDSAHEQVMNQGNFKIPAGYLAVVAGPIVGLQRMHMSYMCLNVAAEIAKDLDTLPGSPQAGAPEMQSSLPGP